MEAESMKYVVDIVKFMAIAACVFSMKPAAEGITKIWLALIDTVGRNPDVKKEVNSFGLIGFATVEAIALYAFLIALIMLFL